MFTYVPLMPFIEQTKKRFLVCYKLHNLLKTHQTPIFCYETLEPSKCHTIIQGPWVVFFEHVRFEVTQI